MLNTLNYYDDPMQLLIIGAMGKSAQIGLHTWLADAMEGPTPVSALIHAATMVTAGVFLVARCSPLFEYAPVSLNFVIIVGAVTSIFAACIAITQNDIKKIIAYSTCSQLGYMFFACGVSAYSAGMFHLMTHAFFKALLFLGAGSIIHALSDEHVMLDIFSNDNFISFILILLKIIALVVPLLVIVAFLTYAERKVIASVQLRKGPNVVGPFGLLQPLADGLKLFSKETIFPTVSNKIVFLLAPMIEEIGIIQKPLLIKDQNG